MPIAPLTNLSRFLPPGMHLWNAFSVLAHLGFDYPACASLSLGDAGLCCEMPLALSRGQIALLQDGVKFQSLTIDAQKSQLLETRKHDVREVANILGIPPHKFGDDTVGVHPLGCMAPNTLKRELQRCFAEFLEQENQSFHVQSSRTER